MDSVWNLLSKFEFLGGLLRRDIGGTTLYYAYIVALFCGFCAWAVWRLAAAPRKAAAWFATPYPYIALTAVVLLALCGGSSDLHNVFSYEAQNLADAAAVVAGAHGLLFKQTRIMPLIFTPVLYAGGMPGIKLLLWVFSGLFFAVWARILSETLGFGHKAGALLALAAVMLRLKIHDVFSAYAIFSLFFSAMFLQSLLPLLREESPSFTRLFRPLAFALMAALFRQESAMLFFVYAAALPFLSRASLRKGLPALALGAVLYLPFLYADWTHEENQKFARDWDQALVEQVYGGALDPRGFMHGGRDLHLLASAACNLRTGSGFAGMDRATFVETVRELYSTPQPSLRNVWYNLKYRSDAFLRATVLWCAVLALGLANLRRLRGRAPELCVLGAYIAALFLVYHLANLAVMINLSYDYVVPAYMAFSAVVLHAVLRRAAPCAAAPGGGAPACPDCGSGEVALFLCGHDLVYSSDEGFPLYRCAACGMIALQDPQGIAARTAYPDSYFKPARGLARLLERLFLRLRMAVLYDACPAGGRILDFGCGSGELVRALTAKGADCFGLDPHAPESGGGAKFIRSTLAASGLPQGALSAVTAWHVLEHLGDPYGELVRLRGLMAPGAALVVSVPNIESWQAAAGGSKWFYLDLPRHIRHFSPATLEALLRRAGFEPARLSHFSPEYGPFGWWQTLLNLCGGEPDLAFRYLKRGEVPPARNRVLRAYTILLTAVCAPVLIPLACALSLAESAAGHGGVITVSAKKAAPAR